MDNTFWATVALVLFFALVVYLKGFRRINDSLDDRAKRIQTELEEARELKEEAKQQLAEYQRRRREAEQEAKEIVEGAKRESQAILADAKRKNEEFVQRRTAMAEQKIAQAETDAIAEVRSTAVDVAIAAATKIIAERNQNGNAQPISTSIDAMRGLFALVRRGYSGSAGPQTAAEVLSGPKLIRWSGLGPSACKASRWALVP